MEKEIDQYLEDLILRKNFNELSKKEKQIVESKLSKEEYIYYHQELLNTLKFYEKEEENLHLREGLKDELLIQFDSKFSSSFNFSDYLINLFMKPITYRVSGVGVVILLILFYFNSGLDTTDYDISDEEFIQYTQFIQEDMPASNTTEQLENMDFLDDF